MKLGIPWITYALLVLVYVLPVAGLKLLEVLFQKSGSGGEEGPPIFMVSIFDAIHQLIIPGIFLHVLWTVFINRIYFSETGVYSYFGNQLRRHILWKDVANVQERVWPTWSFSIQAANGAKIRVPLSAKTAGQMEGDLKKRYPSLAVVNPKKPIVAKLFFPAVVISYLAILVLTFLAELRFTLILVGVVHGNVNFVRLANVLGADLNAPLSSGKEMTEDVTPLIVAVAGKRPEIVDYLVKNGADVNLTESTHGRSPIFFAAKNGDLEMIKFLKERKARVDLKDKSGKSPSDLAVEAKCESCAEELGLGSGH